MTRQTPFGTDHRSTRTRKASETATETTTMTASETDTTTTTEGTTMTANDTTTAAGQTRADNTRPAATMGGVDQTHPDTNEAFGFTVYGRGVAADGGRDQEEESMEDVDHESDTGGSNRTFERGKDGGDE
jgi:hypothetical protein